MIDVKMKESIMQTHTHVCVVSDMLIFQCERNNFWHVRPGVSKYSLTLTIVCSYTIRTKEKNECGFSFSMGFIYLNVNIAFIHLFKCCVVARMCVWVTFSCINLVEYKLKMLFRKILNETKIMWKRSDNKIMFFFLYLIFLST